MPSPFPGMNPYLEQEDSWHDFHQSFIPSAREQLTPQVQPNYLVKVEDLLFIHELPAEARRLIGQGDVSVAAAKKGSPSSERVSVLAAPAQARVPLGVDIEQHNYLEIRDRRNRALITVIELLSPTNKRPGPDREQYLAKRRQLLLSSVHLVEIDLLRGGPRLPIDHLPPCDYYALVSRVEDRPDVGIWPIGLRDPLPRISIPLRAPDPDAYLDLQQILHRLYDAAGYQQYIYSGSPQPPLPPEDEDWAQQFLPPSPP